MYSRYVISWCGNLCVKLGVTFKQICIYHSVPWCTRPQPVLPVVYKCVCVCVDIFINIYVCICVSVCMYLCINVCVYVCVYVYIFKYVDV